MKIISIIFLVAVLFTITPTIQAQKALPLEINGLLAKVPSLQGSEENFHTCTTVTDPTNNTVGVKDAGAAITNLETTLQNDMQQLAMGSSASGSYGGSNPEMPSASQIAQMQQQARQMQGMSPEQAQQMAMKMSQQMAQNVPQQSAPPTSQVDLMEELGTAQTASSKISVTLGEFTTKATQLESEYNQKIGEIQLNDDCQSYKVQGADMALPKCDCVKSRYLDFYQSRVKLEDEFLQRLNAIIQTCLSDIKGQIAIIDKAEKDLKYGEAVGIPAFRAQVVTVQQTTLSYILPLVGMVEKVIKESGTVYSDVYNTNNGFLPEPCQ